MIVYGQISNAHYTLFETVMDCTKDTTLEEEEDYCSNEDDDSEYYHTKLCLALTIIGNSAYVLLQYEDESDGITELEELKELLSMVNSYVKEHTCSSSMEPSTISSPIHIQTVYQASQCIFHLITLSKELKNMAMNIGVLGVVSDCMEGGCTKHKLLADVLQEIVAFLRQNSKTEKIAKYL